MPEQELNSHTVRPHPTSLSCLICLSYLRWGVGNSGHPTISKCLSSYFPPYPQPGSVAARQQMGRLELTVNKSGGQNQVSRV